MNYRRKLKSSSTVSIFLPAFISYILFFVALVLLGLSVALKVVGITMLVYSLLTLVPYFRTKNYGFLLSSGFMLLLAAFVLSVPAESILDGNPRTIPSYSALLIVAIIALMIVLIYLSYSRKLKWRGAEIFELAAINIDESAESYTARPKPVMKLDYNKTELREFAEFLSSKLICLSFKEDNRYVYMPVKTTEEIPLLYKPRIDYEGRTWVAFDYDGNISVNIARRDYLYYKDDLDFDQLCNSMGQLFLDFFELFRKGNEIRIMDRLDELNLSIFK